ncbi:MAG: hypothetical protein JW746_01435 [Candidatus Krumholzibacteriota bacterium]|nr:hypothetical protein [Candidatus Krumholzibacteriota bacterium]
MSELETPAECLIRVDNKEIKFNIARIQLDQVINDHHQLVVRIQQVGKKEAAKDFDDPGQYTKFLGSNIALNIRPTGGIVDDSRALEFIGVITDVEFDNSIDGLNNVIIRAASPTVTMDGAAKNAHFHEKSASDIIGAIVGNYPITLGKLEKTSAKFKFDTQYRESDFDYIMRLASGSGMFAYYTGRDFNLAPANSEKTVELLWRENLGAFRVGLGTAPMEFKADVYNYEQKKTYSQDSQSVSEQSALSNISKISPEASKKIYKNSGYSSAPKTIEDAKSLDKTLQNERRKAMGSMVRCNGHSIVPEVVTGSCVKISGMDKLDGQYWVKGVRHVFDDSGKYHNTFVCSPLDIAYPEKRKIEKDLNTAEVSAESVSAASSASETAERSSVEAVRETRKKPAAGINIARVVDLKDPDKLGRIKVSYPWLDSEQTAWVRIMVPHAGKDRGWYVLPELEDEVLIGYEHGSSDHPIVLGCLYNKDNSPVQDAVSDENDVKMFMTRSGNRLMFTDKDGSEQITISQKDGKNQIVLDISGPSISITTEGEVSIKGANINLEANDGITMKAGADIKLEGTNIELKAEANIKSEAGANNDVAGNAQVNVKGGMINLN